MTTKYMKRLSGILVWWRLALLIVTACAVALSILMHRLATLIPVLSPVEQSLASSNPSWLLIINNPLHLPTKLLHFAISHLPYLHDPILIARLPSVIMASIALSLFTYILHRWYGRRSMVFGFAILISSAWFLHLGRFAGYDIEYFLATLALLSMHIGLYDHPNSRTRWYLWIVVNILLLTIPGMVWLVLLSTAWQWSTLRKAWSQSTLTHRLSLLALLLAGGGSLAATFIHNSRLLTSWAGISDFNMRILRDLPAKLWENILAIGVHGQSQPELWLKGMPMLDFFLLGMLIIGAAFYIRHWQANRARLLAALLTLSLLLASLGVVSLSIIAPLLYLIVVAGTAYILHFWLHTFPRNPLARTAGIGVITALVALSCFFNLTSYFVAWPHNPETIRAYHLTQ